MKRLVYGMLVLLAVLHQDNWWWDMAEPMLFGFIPIGLSYHAFISIAAAVLWALAVKYCWPAGLDESEPRDGLGDREGRSA